MEQKELNDYFTEDFFEDSVSVKQARRYIMNLSVINNGTIDAINCSLTVSSIKISKNGKRTSLKINNKKLLWDNSEEKHRISPSLRATFTALILDSGSTMQNAKDAQKNEDDEPFIQIGENRLSKDDCTGTMEILYHLTSDNMALHIINLSIKWDGTWESRLIDLTKDSKLSTEEIQISPWRKWRKKI